MTVAITLLLIVATLISLGYPWLRPRASVSSSRKSESDARSIQILEDDIERDIKRLRQTGKPTREVCRKCGAEYPKEARFCPQCGAKL